ncbi:hypothetical protein ACQP04_19760 [Pseudonocardia halophobica]|uniref:hypothetical protein n=1 Tax=Pseudonocardia halophobica TaxID=29401 RepID=UPI003D8B2923
MATTSDVVRQAGEPERPAGLPDRYRLDARLGSGRRRRLYRAWDDVLCRPIVVELLEPSPTGPAVAGLHHPNLAALYDVGSCGDGHFVVTQLVDGPSLADPTTRRTLSVPALLAAGTRVAEALAYLHAHGVAHGAVEPDAVRFDRGGEAHLLGRVHRPPEAAYGTTAFDARAAADVAQLGRLLHRCLPRRSWGRAAPGVPAGVAALLAGAAAADPAARPTAAGLAAGLVRECGRVGDPGPARPARPTAHRRVAVVAALGAAVAVVVGRPAFGPGGPVAPAPATPAAAAAGAAEPASAGIRDATVLPAPPVVIPVLAEAVAGAQAQVTRALRASAHPGSREVPRTPPRPPAEAPIPRPPGDADDRDTGHDTRHGTWERTYDRTWDGGRHDRWDDSWDDEYRYADTHGDDEWDGGRWS